MQYYSVVQSWRVLETNKHSLRASQIINPGSAETSTPAPASTSRKTCFAQLLQRRRIECNLSLQALGRLVMLDPELLARYERAEDEPSAEIERRVLRVLAHHEVASNQQR